MNKIILILILSISLYSDKFIEPIIPECKELHLSYIYYKNRAEKETSTELGNRWLNISDNYKIKYDECTLSIKNENKPKSYYRTNKYK